VGEALKYIGVVAMVKRPRNETAFVYLNIMTVKNRLRNSLIRKLQQLSTDKLTEINTFLSKIEGQLKSKEKTLRLAGAWKDLDDSIFDELTEKLHQNRSEDRQIN
jgi:hypothetical protein